MLKRILRSLLFLPLFCFSSLPPSPFDYDLHLTSVAGTKERTIVCFHGYGDSHKIADKLKKLHGIDASLISFDFPDHDVMQRELNPQFFTFGTIQELLPALYVLKMQVIDEGKKAIDLYGFSAGGAVVINTIGILNSNAHDRELNKIGIGQSEKKAILEAIQNGVILLDTPLKSIEEIIDLRGSSPELALIAKKYRDNQFSPIDSLSKLKGLSLDIILHFQKTDEIIFNRDDALYIERLKRANSLGTTHVLIADEGGHMAPHTSLWNYYSEKTKTTPMNYSQKSQQKKLVIGISTRTTNELGQAAKDIPRLRDVFLKESIQEKIPGRLNEDVLVIYTHYESDHTKPYTCIIGCEVSSLDSIPDGMVGVEIPEATYAVFSSQGSFPDSLIKTWQAIWSSNLTRSYTADYEVYPPSFNPVSNSQIDVFIATKK